MGRGVKVTGLAKQMNEEAVTFSCSTNHSKYGRLSLNGHLYKMDTSVKRTARVGPCFSLLPLFDSL